MRLHEFIEEDKNDEWDPEEVVPCARCGEPIDFNVEDDCTNPNCKPTDDEYTRGSDKGYR